jgi:hypothetical protein
MTSITCAVYFSSGIRGKPGIRKTKKPGTKKPGTLPILFGMDIAVSFSVMKRIVRIELTLTSP